MASPKVLNGPIERLFWTWVIDPDNSDLQYSLGPFSKSKRSIQNEGSNMKALKNNYTVALEETPWSWNSGNESGLYRAFLNKWDIHFTETAYNQRVEDAACARMKAMFH